MRKFNPFTPNSPVYPDMFAGREKEIIKIENSLYQTKLGNPSHVLIIGERGIGKSSLLLVSEFLASKECGKFNFLVVPLFINDNTTLEDLARNIKFGIERQLGQDEKILSFTKSTWSFLQKFEAAGVKYNSNEQKFASELVDNIVFSVADTIKAITNKSLLSDVGLREPKDGIVFLIDEADNAAKNLKLGVFLKNLSERLIFERCNKFLLIVAGLPRLRDALRESHESSLRLFEDIELNVLSSNEVKTVIKNGLGRANEQSNGVVYSIESNALNDIFIFSEGYPHFVQQIAASSFVADLDNVITTEDVDNGLYEALFQIGQKYYHDLYFNKINVDSYREILNIMARKWDQWVSKKEIENEFKGSQASLVNGLKALRDRNIILSKIGSKGMYRLQWKGFALWIKTIAEKSMNVQANDR
jgi:Cdc6-like AAA superfamily ATPase